jgi:hypothetical protein
MERYLLLAVFSLCLASCSPAPDTSPLQSQTPSSEPAEPAMATAAADAPSSAETSPSDDASPAADTSQDTAAGEPITLHARLIYKDEFHNPSIGAVTSLDANLHITTDVLRSGQGAAATYALDQGVERVQGSVKAQGQVNFSADDIATQEIYQMQGDWPQLSTASAGQFSIMLPEPSDIGEGLRIKLLVKAPVAGNKSAQIQGKGQQINAEVTHSRPMWCGEREGGSDLCDLSFTIDATPTNAKTPIGEVMFENAKHVYNLQGKKDATGGLLMYSNSMPVYGAITNYELGHFVTRLKTSYTQTLDGGTVSQQLDIVVWSTARGSDWQPTF